MSLTKEVRIRVSGDVHKELLNIAKEKEGVTLNYFLKGKMRKIVDDYYQQHPHHRRVT